MPSPFETLDALARQARDRAGPGNLPSYVPALAAAADRRHFAATWHSNGKTLWTFGDVDRPVPTMSAIKPFILAYLFALNCGDAVRDRLTCRPSALPYNSLEQLQADGGRPRNGCLNSGAIALCDLLPGAGPVERCEQFWRWLEPKNNDGDRPNAITLDHHTLDSVSANPNPRNQAIVDLLVAAGHCSDRDRAITTYNRICCLAMATTTLARLGDQHLNHPDTSDTDQAFVLDTLAVGGLYELSSHFFKTTGWRAKSSISGLLLGIHPSAGTLAIWSPPLDSQGNSIAGRWFLDRAITIIT